MQLPQELEKADSTGHSIYFSAIPNLLYDPGQTASPLCASESLCFWENSGKGYKTNVRDMLGRGPLPLEAPSTHSATKDWWVYRAWGGLSMSCKQLMSPEDHSQSAKPVRLSPEILRK